LIDDRADEPEKLLSRFGLVSPADFSSTRGEVVESGRI